MNVVPIQVTDEGVLIPKVYLHEAAEVEVEITAEYVIVRPKGRQAAESPAQRRKPVRIYSPQLANRKQAKDFALKVTVES
ncbi:MAG: hypothetical protein HYZ49_02730 [Chloroflexi bacterium]|nr:hypothetical protein [Chloroflexota bacterium]